jgi:hypothetical protein
MIQAINFTGERIADKVIEDICDFDTDKTYVLSFSDCGRRQFLAIEDYLTTITGYDVAETQ